MTNPLADTSRAALEARGMHWLGLATEWVDPLHRLVSQAPLLEGFTLSEIATLGAFMPVYEAAAGCVVIAEGEAGDFLIILIEGSMDVTRLDNTGLLSRIAVVQEGHALGEMSMIDGEPRFASCTALENSRFAVLSRAVLTDIIQREPRIGAKILVKLVHILAQRLRNTSMHLVACRAGNEK